MKLKPLAVELFGGIAFFVVFSVLGYIAITEQSISIGSPRFGSSVGYASGQRAIWVGLSLIAAAFTAVAYLLRYAKYKALYWAFLFSVWLGLVLWQLAIGF